MLTKAEHVAFARCWGLWVRWQALERQRRAEGWTIDRAVLYGLWRAIREEMRDE